MEEKNRALLHKRSTELDDFKAKLPSASDIEYGEIAINYAKGYETISIKNNDDEIVTFSNDSKFEEELSATTEVISSALNDLDEKVNKLGNFKFWKGTLTEYVAIKDKDPDCVYFIVDNNINATTD